MGMAGQNLSERMKEKSFADKRKHRLTLNKFLSSLQRGKLTKRHQNKPPRGVVEQRSEQFQSWGLKNDNVFRTHVPKGNAGPDNPVGVLWQKNTDQPRGGKSTDYNKLSSGGDCAGGKENKEISRSKRWGRIIF